MNFHHKILSDRTIRRQAVAAANQIVLDLEKYQRNDQISDLSNNDISIVYEDNSDLYTEKNDDAVVSDEDQGDRDIDYGNQTDTDSDSDGSVDDEIEFADKLKDWFLISGTPLVHANKLLHLLRNYFPLLPKDARTLLQTEKKYKIEEIAGGKYHHFGIEEGLNQKLSRLTYLHEKMYSVSCT